MSASMRFLSARRRRMGLVALGAAVAVVAPSTAVSWTTYPADFDFTNDTPYTLHVWPENQSGDECWDNPGNPNVTLAPGERRGGRAWTQERHLHCHIAFRVAIVGRQDVGDYPLKATQPFYSGRASETNPTFTMYFPGGPRGDVQFWAPWGYWPLPQRAVGVDMSQNSALFFRVNPRGDNRGTWGKCRDNNDSAIYCHVTISTTGPGSIRPQEFFEKGVRPSASANARDVARETAEPQAWPTVAAIQAEGCLARGIIESMCAKAAEGKVDFTGLSVLEKTFTLDTKSVQIVGDPVDNGTWANTSNTANKYTFTRTLTVGEDSTSTSTHSHSVGGSINFSVKKTVDTKIVAMEKQFSVTVNTDHKWEYSDTRTTSKSDSKSSSYEINVPKQTKVDWRILQNAIVQTDAQYNADLVIGPDTDKVEPVVAPTFSSTLISPVDSQPCLAISIGNQDVPYSLIWMKKWVQDTGGVGDPTRSRRFLDNAANFSSSGQCPGMPAGYPSRAQFKGTGYVRFSQRGMSAACTYFSPLGKKSGPSAEPPAGGVQDAPATPQGEETNINNTPPKCDGPKQGNAVSFDAGSIPYADDDVVKGTGYGDLLKAGNRSGVTLLGGGSRDIVEGGRGTGNVLDGQEGDDIVTGGPAAEILRGGPGSDFLKGGRGADELSDDAGTGNMLDGGAGNDRLSASNGRSTLAGGPGADVLIARGGATGMSGGSGADTYMIKGGAKVVAINEGRNDGHDVVKSWRSVTLPPMVEELRLQGRRNLTGTASFGRQVLVGNDGNNVLNAGPGFDRMDGGKGNDTIHLSAVGFDDATGGPGNDRFVLNGAPTPTDTVAPKGTPYLAHTVTDFTPGRDTLVLSAKVHGPEVMQLKKVFAVFNPSSPLAQVPRGSGPALVVNTRTGVVKYDRDERGRSPERTLVVLPKGMSLGPKDIEIR